MACPELSRGVDGSAHAPAQPLALSVHVRQGQGLAVRIRVDHDLDERRRVAAPAARALVCPDLG